MLRVLVYFDAAPIAVLPHKISGGRMIRAFSLHCPVSRFLTIRTIVTNACADAQTASRTFSRIFIRIALMSMRIPIAILFAGMSSLFHTISDPVSIFRHASPLAP